MERVHPPVSAEPSIPPNMATRLAGWAARAHQYPIFSRTWFAFRMRSFRIPLILFALLIVMIAGIIAVMEGARPLRFYITYTALWLVVAVALTLGRTLAVAVRARGWPARREAAGIVCALALGMAAALALTPLVRNSAPPAQGRAPTAQEIKEARQGRIINLIIWIPVVAWLAGPTDLIAYFRQRGLLREAALQAQADRYKDQRDEVEAQLAVLASQVEPHFLFNTLAGVRAAMLSDPARGIVMIDHLIDYLRSTIPQMRADRASTFVALGSQLDSVAAYLGVIQARMPRLQVRVDCPTDLRGAAIPPLMLISLVENAVKHGIEPKKGPAQIRVTASAAAVDDVPMLEVTVQDDGAGFAASTGNGIGLANIHARLQHLYAGQATLTLRTADAGGVAAQIVLPLHALDRETI